MRSFYSYGKLLITGEYLVLDGALALSCPTKDGQSMVVESIPDADEPVLAWISIDPDGVWFEGFFQQQDFQPLKSSNEAVAQHLSHLLQEARKLNANFLQDNSSYSVMTLLEFPRNWGLGSSSTLINNVAQWADVDPIQLFFKWANGSGYDVAQATVESPISYRVAEQRANWDRVAFDPEFKDQLFFVYLNEKQNSTQQVQGYQELRAQLELHQLTGAVTDLTKRALAAQDLKSFEAVLTEHEQVLGQVLQQTPVQQRLFSDYKAGVVKSLGAWGGDFVLVTGDVTTPTYFTDKGYTTVRSWSEMIFDPHADE